jgi:hypothetical protein
MLLIARTPAIGWVGDHRRAKRIGLDVSQNYQQVRIVLNHRAPEPALSNMSRTVMTVVVARGVGHRERLKYAADRLSGLGPQEEMKVVRHQAVSEETIAMSARQLSIGQVMMAVGLVATDLAIVRASDGALKYPPIWMLLGVLNFFGIWKLILARRIRAAHYRFRWAASGRWPPYYRQWSGLWSLTVMVACLVCGGLIGLSRLKSKGPRREDGHGVGGRERLKDAADRLTGLGPEQEMKVVRHQAVSE